MRWMVVAAVAGMGCGSDPRDCSVAAVADDYAAGATLADCGAVYDDGVNGLDTAAWQAASTCALDHAQQQVAFRVRWTAQQIEGATSGEYIGMQREGTWTLAAFGQSAGITGMLPPARRYACTALQAASTCNSLRESLCIECVGQSVADECAPQAD